MADWIDRIVAGILGALVAWQMWAELHDWWLALMLGFVTYLVMRWYRERERGDSE